MNSIISHGKIRKNITKDFAEVFNEAWASFKINFEPLEAEYIRGVLRKAKAIIDEEFIWFAYFEGRTNCNLSYVP